MNRFILSEASDDCCIIISNEKNQMTLYDLEGKAYTKNIRNVVNKIYDVASQSEEMYPPVM